MRIGTAMRVGLVLLGLALGYGAALLAGALGFLGRPEGPGAIQGARLPDAALRARDAAADSIWFGDLRVHSTVSFDAMRASLPLTGGDGTHPQADACDFARWCAGLDFFALTDHAESLSAREWRDTVAS